MDVPKAGDGEFDGLRFDALRIDVSRLCVPRQWSESPIWRTSLERVRERFIEAARKPGRLACLLENDSVGICETVEAFYLDGRRVKCIQPESGNAPRRPPRIDPHELRGLPMMARDGRILHHPQESDGSFDPGVGRNYKIHGDLERWKEYSAIAEAAGSCLPGLPAHVTAFVWRDWLNGFDKLPDDTLWTYAVFELAWRQIPGSSLKAERFADVKGCRIPLDAIAVLRADANSEVAAELATLPDNPSRWYSLLDDLLNASIMAIDLLFAIADEPARAPSQNEATPPSDQTPNTVATTVSEPATADNQDTAKILRCQCQAYYAAKYVEAMTGKEHCEAKEVWDWWRNNTFDPSGQDETTVMFLTGYEVPDNFATFEVHWSRANTAKDENRHTPRKGRKGRSTPKADEL